MRREGYIIEEIIEYSNMSEAFDSVLRGTGRKRSRQGRFLLAHREKIIAELTASIADGSFRLGGYHEREIEEYGKKRILQILSMKDRIAVFAIMNVVDRHLQKRYYYRYCDDGLVLGKTKAELWKIRDVIHRQMGKIDLEIKPNERVFPVEEGIDFLGYVIRPDYVRLRKRIKQKFARKMHEVKSRKRRRELIASFYGMTKHADCNKLFKKLTGKEMRSFKDLNVAYKPEDGKKRFPGVVVSIRELVNLPIVVKDFETGIKTEQGEDRCIVAIEVNGEAKKFFTNSEEMKNILAQVKEMPDGFPFETTIKTETFGKGRTKYVFT